MSVLLTILSLPLPNFAHVLSTMENVNGFAAFFPKEFVLSGPLRSATPTLLHLPIPLPTDRKPDSRLVESKYAAFLASAGSERSNV